MKQKSDHRPLLVGTLTSSASIPEQIKKAKAARVDWLECRLDTFLPQNNACDVVKRVRRLWKGTLLLTVRSWTEMGSKVPFAFRLNDHAREKIIGPLLPMVDLVDLEIRRMPFCSRVTSLAHKAGVKVIHSLHRFSSQGRLSNLLVFSERSKKMKGDYFKVAVMPSSREDVEAFLAWGLNQRIRKKNLILISMGPIGVVSRFIGFSFGSVATYGHLGTSAAPGQPSVKDLRTALDALYGH